MPAWAFTSVTEPNVDTGMVAVPQVITDVPGVAQGSNVRPFALVFANTTNIAQTIRVTDQAGAAVVPDVQVPGHSVISPDLPPIKLLGLRWSATGAGINGKFEGWQ